MPGLHSATRGHFYSHFTFLGVLNHIQLGDYWKGPLNSALHRIRLMVSSPQYSQRVY